MSFLRRANPERGYKVPILWRVPRQTHYYIKNKMVFLDKPITTSKTKWYFSTSAIVIALLCLGPLALPLVWLNPRYKIVTKLAATVIVIALTIFFCYLTVNMYLRLTEQIESLGLG
jgi:hypothetical protein